ncbi:MAG: DUF4956 domain-containing protein [Saprospirales bacterium]|nr:DUF4956 domain-containing protein [Saprospirales bacterium]MBK8491014.1 DUF4956 domain-containing protein [Saprospirales bacterium]
MNILQKIQGKYLAEFAENIPFDEFLLNVLLTALLAGILRWYYIRYGHSISNRRRFGNNFLPLALGTLLIIMIVKSSIALSLGLVGALSIVRFRAAIKDPEELTFLFIAIGLGLAGGANEPVLALLSFILIAGLLYLQRGLGQKKGLTQRSGAVYVNIHTDQTDLKEVAAILTGIFPYVELKRMDTLDPGMDLSFLCQGESIDQLATAKEKLLALSAGTRLSIVDQPDLMV